MKYFSLDMQMEFFIKLLDARSGNGSIYLISHDTAEKKLKKAINEFYKLNYPDPTRINDIKEFYDRMKHDYKNVEYFEIIFD